MTLVKHSILAPLSLALCLLLAGCESFDPGMLTDWIPTGKKSLAGDRQPVFPQGVPGVSDGVPPELIKGNQPPPEAQAALPEEPPPAAEKPKPKPKPKKVTSQPPPRQQQSAQPQSSDSPWPSPQPAQSAAQPAQPNWPAPPPAGTFSR
jgi:outer membrane biosynthesis protein TonB